MATNDIAADAATRLTKANKSLTKVAKKGAGRPVDGDPFKGLNQILKPQYNVLRDEILDNSPVLSLDETTQNILKAQGNLIESQLAGDIPADVQSRVSQIAAEKALKGGIVGQSARNLQARDLGLTSLDIQKQGQAAADAYVSREREWSATRTDALMNLRKLDLSAAEMRLERYKIDETMRSQRLQLLSSSLSDYYTRLYSFSTLKNANQETVTNMTQDYSKDLMPYLKKAAGVK